jgi:metalloprotease
MANENIILTRRNILAISALAGGISMVAPAWGQIKVGKMLGAGKDLMEAENISDSDLKLRFDEVAADSDRNNPVAPASSPYGKRIAALSKGLTSYDGMNLDIKAYLVKDVNAFAMGNGTIRVFAGLMDKFTDDEIRYVIGHEMGHVKNGHSKKRMQTALRASAAQKAASGVGGGVGKLASGELGSIFKKVVTSQHSQANEKEADDYAMAFMKAKSYPPMACVTALDKLAAMDGGGGGVSLPWTQTHPSPKERSKRMRSQLAALGIFDALPA